MTATAENPATAVLHVGGLHYASEKAVVESVLSRRPGVIAVDANPVAQTASVVFDRDRTSLARRAGEGAPVDARGRTAAPDTRARRAANHPGVSSVAMSALAIRRTTRRMRRHTAAVLVVLALGAIIAVHHSAIASGEMHHAGMGTVVELCLGVFTAVGVAVAAVGLGLRRLGRWDTPARLLPLGVRLVARWLTLEPRAGPPGRALLCVWRR